MLAQFDAAIKGVGAMLANERLQRVMIGVENVDRQLVMLAYAIDQLIRFGRKPPGVQREYPDRQRVARDQIGQHHILGAETAGERRRRMASRDTMEQGACLFALVLERHCSIHSGVTLPSCEPRRRNSGTGSPTIA